MSEKEKNEIAEMVETAELLAKHDPQSLVIAKANLDILKSRCEIEKAMREESAGQQFYAWGKSVTCKVK